MGHGGEEEEGLGGMHEVSFWQSLHPVQTDKEIALGAH